MVSTEKNLTIPANPPVGWDVVVRKRTFQDFKTTIKTLVFVIFLASLVIFSYSGTSLFNSEVIETLRILGYVFGCGAAGILLLFILPNDCHRAEYAAYEECRARSNEWRDTVLKVYLEKKYDLRFSQDLNVAAWRIFSAVKDNHTIEVAIHGLNVDRSYKFGEGYGYSNFKIDEDVWLEEVIRPEKVSYRSMKPAVATTR